MKKLTKLMFIIGLCAVVMSACTEKNNPSEPSKPDDPTKPEKKAAKAYLDFQLAVGEDMFALCAFSIDYLDKEGKVQHYELKDTTACRLVIISEGLPAKLGYNLNITKRDDVDYSQVKDFVVNYKYNYYTGLIDTNGDVMADGLWGGQKPGLLMDISQMDKWLKQYDEERKVQKTFEFDAEGKETEGNW